MTYYLLLITIVSIIYLGQLSLIASIHLPTNSSEPLSNVGLHDVSVFEVCLNKILLPSYFHSRCHSELVSESLDAETSSA